MLSENQVPWSSSTVKTVSYQTAKADLLPRLLVVDDNPDIHEDFRKVLGEKTTATALVEAEAAILNAQPDFGSRDCFCIDSATQGLAAVECVERLAKTSTYYSVAFVDIRMPPGIDGVETAQRIWAVDPDLQIVFCTAYSDYTWEALVRHLGRNHRFLVLKKPFDAIEVRQLALALSEKRRLLQENQLTLRSLEDRVRQRTAALELTHAELHKEMQDRLRLERGLRYTQKLEALGRLAAGIGHEINNPLTYVMNNLELLQHEVRIRGVEVFGDADPSALTEVQNCIEEALLGTRRIKQIVRGTRLFAQVSESPPTNANVTQCLRAAMALVRCELRRKARLVDQLRDVPPVVGDSPQLEQVFVNLLLNSIQAIPIRSDGEIRVSNQQRDATSVEVCISDNGCGIHEMDLVHVFEPFFSTRPEGEGTGLGLWVSKSVVEAFGGTIAVESAPGRGTEVRITLRIADESAWPSRASEPALG